MTNFMQSLINPSRGSQQQQYRDAVDLIQEDSENEEFDESRQDQEESSALAIHAGKYMKEKQAFQRTFGKEYDLNIDELNSSEIDQTSSSKYRGEENSEVNETRCMEESELMKVRYLKQKPLINRAQMQSLQDSDASITSSTLRENRSKQQRPSRWGGH